MHFISYISLQYWQDIYFFKKMTFIATTVYASSLIWNNTIVNYRMKIEWEDTVVIGEDTVVIGEDRGAEKPVSAPLDKL